MELTSNTQQAAKAQPAVRGSDYFALLMRLDVKCAASSFELTQYKRDEDKLERVQQRKGSTSVVRDWSK